MRSKRRTYRLSGGRRILTQKAGGRKHRKKNPKGKKKKKKNSKKRPQKQSKVTLDDYDNLQEVMLKRSEALPKPLEKVNIFNNNAITQKVIGKYMYGPGYQTGEELEDEEEELTSYLYNLDGDVLMNATSWLTTFINDYKSLLNSNLL